MDVRLAVAASAVGSMLTLGLTAAPVASAGVEPVYVWMVNDSDRQMSVTSDDRGEWILVPGEAFSVTDERPDITVTWCEDSRDFEPDCRESNTFRMRWGSSWPGDPWMSVTLYRRNGDANHDLRFFSPNQKKTYIPYGDAGRVRFATQRVGDRVNGVPRFRVQIRTIPNDRA